MPTIQDLKKITEDEFLDIIRNTILLGDKLRIYFRDESYVDAYISQKQPGKFGFHWEKKDQTGSIFRYDNYFDNKLRHLETYPHHFHYKHHDHTVASPFPLEPIDGFRAFMEFIRRNLSKSPEYAVHEI
jgi:hypothetical protein